MIVKQRHFEFDELMVVENMNDQKLDTIFS